MNLKLFWDSLKIEKLSSIISYYVLFYSFSRFSPSFVWEGFSLRDAYQYVLLLWIQNYYFKEFNRCINNLIRCINYPNLCINDPTLVCLNEFGCWLTLNDKNR